MAEYTIELKDVVDLGHNIFDFPYPFYDEKERPKFEERFIRHFYFREICCPTVDRFKIYVRDKMETVFPYYNKLFEASLVEYDLLNNYNLTEEITTERENEGKTRGESYTVGMLSGEQTTQSEQNRVTDTEGNVSATGKETSVETSHSETDATHHSETDNNVDVVSDRTQNVSGVTTETDKETKSNTRKFLDTPQGLTDLSDSAYLTDLTHVAENNNINKTVNADTDTTGHDESTTTGHSETDGTDHSETNATVNGERNTESNQDSTGKETTKDTATGSVTDEQKSTQDNNTRTYLENKTKEVHKMSRIGNIGVQTGADMIRIHVDLQKTLRNIERMFFDECEDLFMMVY